MFRLLKSRSFNSRRRAEMSHTGQMTAESEYFKLATLMGGIGVARQEDVRAVIAMPGIGNNNRTLEGATSAMWNNDDQLLLVAGYHVKGKFSLNGTLDMIYDVGYDIDSERVRVQGTAKHTGEQAVWVAQQVEELGIESALLHVSDFHLLRNWLTTLEALRRRNIRIPLVPVPVKHNPFRKEILDVSTNRRTLRVVDVIDAEIARIRAYQNPKEDGSPGDCLTTDRAINYLEWLWQQDILPLNNPK